MAKTFKGYFYKVKTLGVMLLMTSILGVRTSSATENGLRCAILLNGLGRTAGSLGPIESALKKRGYLVWNEGYSSRSASIEELSPIIGKALSFCDQHHADSIYFVTHSMGGLLLRYYFQNLKVEKVKAAVMLAPPNHGSEIVDRYGDRWWLEWLLGPAALELGTAPESLPNRLQPIDIPIGVIAGTKNREPWFADLFHGPSDGKVSVESTKLTEMKDFLTLPLTHTFIMNSNQVINQVLQFFENKEFARGV